MIYLLIPVLAALVFIISFLMFSDYNHFKKHNIPGPRPEFFFGNTKKSILKKRNIAYDVDDIYKKFKGKTPFAGFFHGKTPYILALDPEVVKICRKFRNNNFAVDGKKDPVMSMNIFFVKDDVWKEKRKYIDAAVTSGKIKSMFPLIVNSAQNLTNYIERETDVDKKKMLDARDFTVRFTSDVIYRCLYGIDAKSFDCEKSLMLEYGRNFLKGIMSSLVSVFELQMVSKDVENFFANLTNDAIKHRTDNNLGQDDMLAHAVTLKQVKKLSDLEILGHCMTLFLNSFETSALTLQNMLYQLGMNSKVQEKLRSEIIEKIKTGEDFTYKNVSELSYLDQVFYETLRLHPGLVFTTRVSTEDINIKGSDGKDHMLKKNSEIWIPIHSIHRDAEHYSNPEEFIPERFDAQHGGVKAFADRCVLIPFGVGGRTCPGKKFAHVQVKTAVVEVLRKFEVFIDKNTLLKISPYEFMNIPDKKVFINFKKI